MTIPSFTSEASLYATVQHYRAAAVYNAEGFDSVLAQQLCRHLGSLAGESISFAIWA